MRMGPLRCATTLVFVLLAGAAGQAQDQPLRLIQTIPMPHVKGRIDHMDADVSGRRLFVAGLDNGSVEVVDLKRGKWQRSIPGFKKPQGILYVGSLNKLFVASGDDAMLRVFKGDTLQHRVIAADRKSTRLNSSHSSISYAVFCLKKKKTTHTK